MSVVFSGYCTNKTDRHDITEIMLKVVLNTITLTPQMLKLLSYLVPLVFEFVCTLYDCMVYFLFHQRYNSQTVTYMWYFDFDKLGDSCYFYVIFDIFMGDILKCCDEVIFCRRGSNMIWMAIGKYCTCMCACILFFNNLIWFESCNLIGWSAWRKFWLYLITWVGIVASPTYSLANDKFK